MVVVLALTVAAGLARYLSGVPHVLAFVLAGLALAGGAWIVSFSTEQVGGRFGVAVTGMMQSTLGNLPEFFVVLFALQAGQLVVAQTAILGSILVNALLVLGLVIIAGARREPDGVMRFSPRLPNDTATLLLISSFIILLVGLADHSHDAASHHIKAISIVSAIAILTVYGFWVRQYLSTEHPEDTEGEAPRLATGASLVLLIASGVAAAFVSDWFVHALEPSIHSLGISKAGREGPFRAGDLGRQELGRPGRRVPVPAARAGVAADRDDIDVRAGARLHRSAAGDRGDRLADHRRRRGDRVRGRRAVRGVRDPGGRRGVRMSATRSARAAPAQLGRRSWFISCEAGQAFDGLGSRAHQRHDRGTGETMRRRVTSSTPGWALAAALVATFAIGATASATGKSCHPTGTAPVITSPCNGATIGATHYTVFTATMTTPGTGRFPPYVHLSATKRNGRVTHWTNGHGLDGRMHRVRAGSHDYIYKPLHVTFPQYWLDKPGTYYVQIDVEPDNGGNIYGPISTIHVR